jgi:hypothetical protein
MKYVYGSKKFVARVWRACGKAVPLADIAGIYKLPCGAVLYTDLPLSAATKIKLKAPCITVRTPGAEVEDVQLLQLDVYELLVDIENWGTCDVYVPDDGLRKALSQLAKDTPIRFEKTCPPTYRCAPRVKLPDPDPTSLIFESLYYYHRRPYLPPTRVPLRPLRSYTVPTGITEVYLPRRMKTDVRCTAIGSSFFGGIDWDYYIEHPLDITPEELAAALKAKRLKFLKAVPKLKPLKTLCPKNP